MRLFGLIGKSLNHSFSKDYFNHKFKESGISSNHRYELFPLNAIDEFPRLIAAHPELQGLNVTIPYKQSVIPYLDELDEVARVTGAVNTILIRNAKLKGFNTDVIGFEQSLTPLLKLHHTQALILGTGGAAKAVAYVLGLKGINYTFVSSSNKPGSISYEQVDEEKMSKNLLIINASPVGTIPNINECPAIPYHLSTEKHLFYDLVYNPAETLFLKKAKAQGAGIKNGLEMLQLQAEAAWKIWND